MATKVISSIHGRIEQLFMVYEQDDHNIYQKLLEELFEKLPEYTQVIVLVYTITDHHLFLIRKLTKRFPKYKFAADFSSSTKNAKGIILEKQSLPKQEISKWARDHFLVFQNSKHTLPRLLKPVDQKDSDSLENLEYYKVAGQAISVPDWFCIDGGNILVGKSHILIGGNEFSDAVSKLNLGMIPIDKEKAITFLTSNLDHHKEIIIVGDETHDGNDIASFAKEGTEYSSSLGIFIPELWFEEQQRETTGLVPFNDNVLDLNPVKVHIDMFISMTGEQWGDKPIIFIGQPIALEREFADIANQIEDHITDIIKKQLSKKFTIMRNPMPVMRTIEGKREVCLYNNCLVENLPEKKTVWLPAFASAPYAKQLTPYEEANKLLWKKIGFEVKMIETDFHFYSVERGALHCLTNELIRTAANE